MIIPNGDAAKNFAFCRAIGKDNIKCIYGNSIDELVDSAIALDDNLFTYYFVKEYIKFMNESHIAKLEDFFLKNTSEKIWIIISFAEIVSEAFKAYDLSKIEDTIVASGNVYRIRDYAERVSSANIERLQEIVLESKDPNNIYCFAAHVKGADIQKLYEAELKTESKLYITCFNWYIFHKKKTFKERLIMFWYE